MKTSPNNKSITSDLIVQKIRHGLEPDNPTLIKLWLEQIPIKQLPTEELREIYTQQFYVLLETVLDDLVPIHWRRTCLNNIYLPLSSLKKLPNCTLTERNLHRLFHELAVSTRYVEKTLTYIAMEP